MKTTGWVGWNDAGQAARIKTDHRKTRYIARHFLAALLGSSALTWGLPVAHADGWRERLAELDAGAPANFQVAQATADIDFAVPAQPLATALTAFGTQSGYQIAVDPAVVADVSSPGVTGRMQPEAALDALLAGTGLVWQLVEANSVLLTRPAGDDSTQLAPLAVEDQMEATTTTEDSGSYTTGAATIGSKIPTSLRETPQSLSVITRERLDDQNLTTLPEVLEQTTGMTVNSFDGSGVLNTIFSRGFEVDLVQLDGVMVGGSQGSYATSMDMAIYDHVEVLRGPAGLFQGAGEPGGAINLARKRALDEFTVAGTGSAGSWDSYRGEVDVSGPLVESGAVRGRLVGVYTDADSFVNDVNSDKNVVYGTFEFDVTDNTTLSIGGARQEINAVFDQGLPAYANGDLLMKKSDRDTYVGSDWNDLTTETVDTFVELEHRFENDAIAKLTTRYVNRTMDNMSARANSAINPVTGNVTMQTARNKREKENINVSGYVTTPIEIAGLTQNIVVGADYQIEDESLATGRGPNRVQNVFDPNSGNPEPDLPLTATRNKTSQEEYGVYGQVRLKPIDWATLILGGRFSWYDLASHASTPTISTRASLSVDHEFTPYGGLVVDVTDELSLYGSYADVFQPQSALTSSGTPVPPRIGNQYEVGIKGEFLEGRLNTHLAFYRIMDENRAIADPDDDEFSIAAGKVRSQGFETEVSGTPLPGWNIVVGYAYNENKYLKDPVNEGVPFSTITPKHSANIFSKYTLQEGMLEGVNFGAGVRFQSSTYVTSGAVQLHQDPYAIVDAQVGYEFNENVEMSLAVSNIFDEVYYRKLGAITRQNYFGEPRNVLLTLRAKW